MSAHFNSSMTIASQSPESGTTIVGYQTEQHRRADASGRQPIVFVHGLWLLQSSWARREALFEEAGFYASLAPDGL